MSDAVAVLIELNIALAAAIVLVALIRLPVRHRYGSRASYGLWWAVPAAMFAVCLPRAGSVVTGPQTAVEAVSEPVALGLLLIWGAGVLLSVGAIAAGQMRFDQLARRGLAGPAVTGVIVGRIVMPRDSARRWTPDELAIIRAHERAHMDRGDLRTNAMVALGRCLFWCNPMAHVGLRLFRFDQELACDATIMATRVGRRRLYGEALLKASPVAPVAFACGVGLSQASALEARLKALRMGKRASSQAAAVSGCLAIVAAAGLAFALQPPTPPTVAPGHEPVLNIRLRPAALNPTNPE